MANASDLSLRGGQRPTWRPEREARGSALGVQSREGSHVDRTRHCRGADSRARLRTYSPYKPPSKWQTLPICHCEEAFRILPYSFFSLQDSFISVPRPYSELPGKAQKKLRSFDRSFMLALPIFPCSHPQSIVGANELNFCVRDGNRWTLITINTNLFCRASL